MKALILKSPKNLELIESEPYQPLTNKDFILIKVLYCGLCRTDAKMWELGHRDLVLPRVLGHEFCGELDNKYFVIWPGYSCGLCAQCKQARENLCDDIKILGFHLDGGLRDMAYVPKSSMIPVTEEIPLHLITFAEPIACCLNGIESLIEEGDRVLIIGAGFMGNLLGMCCKESGAIPYITDIDTYKLTSSEDFRTSLKIEAIKDETNKFDMVVNATSEYSGFKDSISYLKKGGKFCFFSGISKQDVIDVNFINEIHYKELTIKGAYGCTKAQMEKALVIISKYKQSLEKLIDRFISLEEVERGFTDILSGKCFKIIVKMED